MARVRYTIEISSYSICSNGCAEQLLSSVYGIGIYNFVDNLEIRCAFFGRKSIYTFAKAKDILFPNLFISNGYKIYVFGFKLD